MKTFNLTGKQILTIENIEVEANTLEEAIEIAQNKECDGFMDTMDIDTTFYETKDEINITKELEKIIDGIEGDTYTADNIQSLINKINNK